MISYDRFWNTLKNAGENWYTLVNKHGINPATLHRLKHNMAVSTKTIALLCKILKCSVADIMEYKPE